MKFYDSFKNWIATGNEIEFCYMGDEYSVTYTEDEKISFCKFYEEPSVFSNADDFIKNAKIGNDLLSDIWDKVVDIYVY